MTFIALSYTYSLIDDMGVQVWSNNEYKAPEHRVRASRTNKRYSSPFFYNPAHDTVIKPILTAQSRNLAPEYDPFVYGHFRQQRFKGDYADAGNEIQIEDFRVNIKSHKKKNRVDQSKEEVVDELVELEQPAI